MVELLGLGGGSKDKNTAKLNSAVSEMSRLYGTGSNQSLSQGNVTVGPQGLLGRIGQDIRKGTDQDYQNRLRAYTQMSTMAMGIINQLRGAGTLNEGEAQLLMKNMPNEYSSETEAENWFSNIRRMLGGASATSAPTAEEEAAALELV